MGGVPSSFASQGELDGVPARARSLTPQPRSPPTARDEQRRTMQKILRSALETLATWPKSLLTEHDVTEQIVADRPLARRLLVRLERDGLLARDRSGRRHITAQGRRAVHTSHAHARGQKRVR